jgi:hypothetical protein
MKSRAGSPRMKNSRKVGTHMLDMLTERRTMDVASKKRSGPGYQPGPDQNHRYTMEWLR